MGMFLCAICDNYADSHDGGEAYKPGHPTDWKMICVDCAAERESAREKKWLNGTPKRSLNMEDKYVAHYGADNESETFQTFEEAKKWLKDQWGEDASEGYSEESCEGKDYIAKITHVSKFVETQNKEKDGYKWNEEAGGFFINGDPEEEEWTSEFDVLGEIRLMEINVLEEKRRGE